jgi:TolB-like protein/Tfp pilus assembly protein PilF
MPQKKSPISRFWQELRRRRVIHVITVYASAAFVLIELVNNLTEPLKLPERLSTIVIIVLGVGFPLAVVLAWIYDLTPEGIEKTRTKDPSGDPEKTSVPNAWRIATYVSFVVIAGLVTLHILGGTKELKAGDIQSLVILPFDNFTGDDALEYFVSGMHASLVNDMGQISGLRVISKTSASAYRGSGLTATQIAQELKVDGVVEASVLCLGDSMCMQFRLINATGEEEQLWTADYREEKSQILNLYNRITRQIADEVKIELLPGEESRLSKDRIVDPDAYDAFLKAQYYWERLTAGGLDSAMFYYRQAIELDPDWADPYSGMAMTLGAIGNFSAGQEDPNMSGAFDYLDKALALDPDAAYSHYVKGIYAVWPFYRWEEGEQEFLRCLELNPSDALCRIYYAHLLMILQRFDESLEQARLALELDPLRPLVLGLYGVVMNFMGYYPEAIEQAEKALSIDPENGFAQGPLLGGKLALGDTLGWYNIWKNRLWWITPAYLDSLDQVFEEEGLLGVIRDRIRINEEVRASGNYISLSGQASRYLIVGETDAALDYYKMAREEGDGFISYMALDHLIYPELKTNPRYLALLKELNLPPPGDMRTIKYIPTP